MITILKRNGRREPLDISKIQKYTAAAVKGLAGVSCTFKMVLHLKQSKRR